MKFDFWFYLISTLYPIDRRVLFVNLFKYDNNKKYDKNRYLDIIKNNDNIDKNRELFSSVINNNISNIIFNEYFLVKRDESNFFIKKINYIPNFVSSILQF